MFTSSAKWGKVSSNIFGINENKWEKDLIMWTVPAPLFLASRSGLQSVLQVGTGGTFLLSLYIWWTVPRFYIAYLIAILITILVYLVISRWLTSQAHDLVCDPKVLACLDLGFRFISSAGSSESYELTCLFLVWSFSSLMFLQS